MPAPLSYDLRTRVVEACKTHSKTEVSKIYKIDRRTVHRYLEQQAKEGDVVPKIGYQKGHSHVLKDLSELEKHVEENPTATLKSMGKKFGVSHGTIHRKLLLLGITKKKNSTLH